MPGPLKVAFNALSLRVRKNNKKDSISNIKVKYGKEFITVNLSITPLHNKNVAPGWRMVTFSERKTFAVTEQVNSVLDEKKYPEQYTLMMEEEVEGA